MLRDAARPVLGYHQLSSRWLHSLTTYLPSEWDVKADRRGAWGVRSQGTYGPFRPQMPTRVPLWLALFLKRRRRCTIVTPDWLHKGASQREIHRESGRGGLTREVERPFQVMPFQLNSFPAMARIPSRHKLSRGWGRCHGQTTWTPS